VKYLRGFTLLELLVVMVIIGLLVGYVAPRYFAQLGKSEINATHAQIDALETALDIYRLDMGSYPDQDLALKALVQQPENNPKWKGPYLEKTIPLDPWGQPYNYRIPGEGREYDLFSYGKDRKLGGSGENADIFNR
jgi:general secretion pathway protein G